MEQLIEKVEAWGRERGLDKTDPLKQYIKLVEEVSELGTAINTGDKAAQEDAIGDIMVVLTVMCMQVGCEDIEKCFFEYFNCTYQGFDGFDETVAFEEAIAYKAKNCAYTSTISMFIKLTYYMGQLSGELSPFFLCLDNVEFRMGKILCALVDISKLLGTRNIFNCYRLAYEEIKDRKGKTVDGVFIKDEETTKANKPCPACAGCTLDEGKPNILRHPCIKAYRDYCVPGESENTEKFVSKYLDVYYCPSCGRKIRNDKR